MAQHTGWLHLNGCHLGYGLHVQIMLGQFVPYLIVLRNDDHLDNHIGLLLRPEASIKWIQFAYSQKTLRVMRSERLESERKLFSASYHAYLLKKATQNEQRLTPQKGATANDFACL